MQLLLQDEDFPYPAVLELRRLGYDIITLTDLDLSNQGLPDYHVVLIATQLKRALLTHNREDFIQIHRKIASKHAGIIVCSRFPDSKNWQKKYILN